MRKLSLAYPLSAFRVSMPLRIVWAATYPMSVEWKCSSDYAARLELKA